MQKFVYVGKEKNHRLIRVGTLQPGQEFTVSDADAAHLDKHPDSYARAEVFAAAKKPNAPVKPEKGSGTPPPTGTTGE